jgi:hypothetical protein
LQDLAAKGPTRARRRCCRRDELLALIDEEPGISLFGAGHGEWPGGPGPLVTYLVSQMGDQIRPVALVPGALSESEIDAMT